MVKKVVDVVVVGAGQAGLSIGYLLKKSRADFIILEANQRIGESWRNRYDSLVLFTPRSHSELPGMAFPGERNSYPTKDETADYLESYADSLSIPVQLDTSVLRLVRNDNGGGFIAYTNKGEYHARSVVIASGPFREPYIPSFSSGLNDDVMQLHSSNYKNPSRLADGDVIIVGAGNSGAQIAVELSKQRQVTLAVGHKPTFLPLELMSKSIFWWFDKLGLLQASIREPVGKLIRKQPDPIFGLELKRQLRNKAIILKPKAVTAGQNRLIYEDGTQSTAANVIWSTGFRPDYRWIQVPYVLDESGKPIHQRGVSSVPGLNFLGLPWQFRRGSALLCGVGMDAEYIYGTLLKKGALQYSIS